jgi:hypothetical protein
MKKLYLFSIILCLLFFISRGLWGSASIYGPTAIPFPYDPNQIDGFFIGGIWSEANHFLAIPIDCNDIHPFVIVALNPPIGMFVINEGDTWRVEWTPVAGQEGTHYVVLEATDVPSIPHQPKSSRGTIVIQIELENLPPVFYPFVDSPLTINIWPQDYQKRWQELRKQGTVMLGPVQMPI